MAQAEAVLDALVWAQYKEPARVAKIAAKLVRGEDRRGRITKTAIADAVRETMPPHGRGKAICEAVALEYERQLPIWRKRQSEQGEWNSYKEHYIDEIAGRVSHSLNAAYAARFGRPVYIPNIQCPFDWNDDRRNKWLEAEKERDKGDKCIGLMLFQESVVVALFEYVNEGPAHSGCTIATIDRLGGEPVYTALRDKCEDFAQAAISLAGPQVHGAFTRGIPVITDWRGRRTTIHYPNKTVELPWNIVKGVVKHHSYNGVPFLDGIQVVIMGSEELSVEESTD